jgi:hypothetical protein
MGNALLENVAHGVDVIFVAAKKTEIAAGARPPPPRTWQVF